MTTSPLTQLLEQAIEYRTGPTWFESDEQGMSALQHRANVLRVADARLNALTPDAFSLLIDAPTLIDCESRAFFEGKTCAEAGYEDELCDSCEWLARFAALEERVAQ